MEKNLQEDIIQNKLGGKRDWTDEERVELCHQLDKELNSHIQSASTKKANVQDKWTEDNWKEEMAKHPIFSPYLQDGQCEEAPVTELSEGLAQLKYDPDHNTPIEVAQNYKEEGNHHFKFKKYRFAIASFSEGIKSNCSDKVLMSQLYNNRAAAHFFLKNYRSALKDCLKAIELKPDYLKAISRGIQCCFCLEAWDEAIEWCDKGLLIETSNVHFVQQRSLALSKKKKADRDLRIAMKESKKNQVTQARKLKAISDRRIKIKSLSNESSGGSFKESDLEPLHPFAKESPVHLNEKDELVWPVLLLYPEFNESDSILEFNENSRFSDHLEEIFGPNTPPPPWDLHHTYKPQNLVIYFEDKDHNRIKNIDPTSTLKEVLSEYRYAVIGGTPCFLILVKNSTFLKKFLSNYSI